MAWRGTAGIGLPKTAMYFVTAAPAGLLDRDEEALACDKHDVDSLLAVLNSSVAYLWWKAWGDGFHVKAATYTAMPDLRSLAPARHRPEYAQRCGKRCTFGLPRPQGCGKMHPVSHLPLWPSPTEAPLNLGGRDTLGG